MSRGNPYKNIIKNAFTPFFDSKSSKKKLNDEKLEFIQFGICDYWIDQFEEISFIHY